MKESKRKMCFTKKVIIALGLFLLAFVVTMIWVFIQFQHIPDTLVTVVFVAVLGEASILGAIKCNENKYNNI